MKQRKYFLIFFLGLLSITVTPLFIPNGGLVGDAPHYMHLAHGFPDIKWSLFPLGYPLVLKFINVFTNDYFWAGRVVNILVYSILMLFSYFKKFHFRETVILLCTKIFFFTMFNVIAEGFFLFLMYFLFYFFYNFFIGKINSYRFYLPASFFMVSLFTVRYSGLFIFIAIALYYLRYFYENRNRLSFFKNDFFYFLLISFLGILTYSFFNFMHFGDFMGETFRSPSEISFFTSDVVENLLGILNSFNPILDLRPSNYNVFTLVIVFFMVVVDCFFIYKFIKVYKEAPKERGFSFYNMLILIGLVYTFFLFLSIHMQRIEGLDTRMLCEASFCYFYLFIILFYKLHKPEKYVYNLAIFSIFFNSLYVVKNPANFLKRKSEVEQKYSLMKGKKYFYNDTRDKVEETTYKIPLIKKEIKYMHGNLQNGPINANIIMAKDPTIEYIGEDTVKFKSQVIYNSEIEQ